MDTNTQINIANNVATQNITSEEAIRINNNKNKLEYSPEEYYKNPKLYEKEIKEGKISGVLLNYDLFKGTAKTLSDAKTYAVIRDYQDELMRKEEALAQKDFEESSFWNRTKEAYIIADLGNERSLLYKDLMDARQAGDPIKAQQIQNKIRSIDKKLSQRRFETKASAARGLGSVSASAFEYVPSFIGEAAVAGAAGIISYALSATGIGAPVAATTGALAVARGAKAYQKAYDLYKKIRPLIKSGIIYNKTADLESGSTYADLDAKYPDMSEARKQDIAMTVGRLNGFIEAAGFTLGTGPLLKSISKGIVSRLATGQITKKMVDNPAFKQALLGRIKDIIVTHGASATSEALEEIIQNAINDTVNDMLKQDLEADINIVNVGKEAVSRLVEYGKNISQYVSKDKNLTEESLENIKTFYETFSGSLIFGGLSRFAGIGIEKGLDKYSDFKINQMKKSVADRLAEGDKNLLIAESYFASKMNSELNKKSPSSFHEHTKNMVIEGTAPQNITIDADAIVDLLDQAQNDENLSAKVEALNLREKLEKAQRLDGDVKIKFEDASQIIFDTENDVLFQKLKNNMRFDDATMSEAGANLFAESMLKQNKSLRERFEDRESLIYDVYNQLKQDMPEDEALANISVLQSILERMRTFGEETISEEQLLKDIGLKFKIDRIQKTPKPKTEKKLFRGERIGDKKVKTKNIELSKIQVDELRGVDVPLIEGSEEGNLIFEDVNGNFIPVTGNSQIAAQKLAGKKGKVKATVISAKNGYTMQDAEQMAKDLKSQEVDIPFQILGDDVAGFYDPRNMKEQIIGLTKSKNPTTFAHEGFHMFFENLLDHYNSGNIREYWSKVLEDAAKWVGAKKINSKYVFTTEQKEKLADGFTDYLLKGKSPVKRLQTMFDLFMDLFSKIYRIIRRKPFKLNKRITSVYDSVFLTYDEVVNQATEERYGILEKPENVTAEEYEDYVSLVRESRGASTTKSVEAASKIAEKQSTQAYKDKVNQYYKEFLPQVLEDRRYEGYDFIAKNKIDSEALKKILPDDVKLKSTMTKKGGMDPTSTAKAWGFEDVIDMVNFLNVEQSSEKVAMEAAKEAANNWLKKEYPELTEVDVKNSTRNIATIKSQILEAMMLRKIPLNQFNLYYNEMIKAVELEIQNMKISEATNIDRLQSRLNMATEKYRIAENNNDKLTMSKIRYRSAVLNYMIMRGNQIRKDVKKFDRHNKRFTKRPTKFQLKFIEGRVWDIINSVLYNFKYTGRKPANMGNVTERIINYADDLQKEGFCMPDTIRQTSYFLSNTNEVNGKNLSVSDFETINNSLRFLEGLSKKRRYLIKQGQELFQEEMVNETIEHISKTKWKPMTEKDWLRKASIGFTSMQEIIFEKLLPAKVHDALILPFMDGLQKSKRWLTDKTKIVKEILDTVEDYREKLFTIDGRNYTGEQLEVIMLHIGNSHNKACLLKTLKEMFGDEFTEESLNKLINAIPKFYRTYAQSMWDFFESNVSEFKEAQAELTGAEIKLVEAEEILFEDGERLRGGYFPAGKKNIGNVIDFSESAGKNTEGLFPTYGFQKERTLITHGELDLSLNPLQSYLTKMSMVINVAKAYDNLGNFLKRPEIRSVLGEEYIRIANDWMSKTIQPDHVNRVIAWWDNIQSVAILGMSPVKAVIQAVGFIPAINKVGLEPIINSLINNTNPYHLLETQRIMKEKSVYMKNRFESPENHIADVRSLSGLSLKYADTKLQQFAQIAMTFVEAGDKFASTITWEAEYNKSIMEGKDEHTAVLRADSAVRTTQGDTSLGSRPQMLQGNLRYLTKFSSYFVAIHSRLSAEAFTGDWYGALRTFMLAGIVSASTEVVLSAWWRWMWADDDEKKKWKKKGINNIGDYMLSQSFDNMISTSSSILLPQFGTGGYLATYALDNKEYAPQVQALTAMLNTATIPVDLAKLPLTETQKEREKLLKRLRKHAFAPLPIKEKRFMQAWDYIQKGF